MFNRSAGVLAHISSIPGKYGIGTFGKEARQFAHFLRSMDIRAWQVLPLCPTDDYNSPYAGCSAFAGNPFFIDPEILFEEGLLTKEELDSCVATQPYSVDFKFLKETRLAVFKKAFDRFKKDNLAVLEKFLKENPHLDNYALFTALKDSHDLLPWWEWPEGEKRRDKKALDKARKALCDEYYFALFLQYEFHTQFASLKKDVNDCGVSIIGDMPIYLAHDSADVWANPHLFSIDDETCQLRCCAGVPPDYFSAEGQKWGNPLYNWDEMKKDGYSWWMERLKASFTLFDIVRIDHFRAFSAYWSVPEDAPTAVTGKWIDGPGMDFFSKVIAKFGDERIIAEDLGIIDDGVIKLIEETNFPCMRVMQFGFDFEDNMHLPHNHPRNSVAYTGTHDNNTALGYLWEATPEERAYVLDYCNFPGGDWALGGFNNTSVKAMIKTLWSSPANLAVVPIQDLCGFGKDTKMNVPGVPNGNWAFRISEEQLKCIDTKWIKNLNKTYHR